MLFGVFGTVSHTTSSDNHQIEAVFVCFRRLTRVNNRILTIFEVYKLYGISVWNPFTL